MAKKLANSTSSVDTNSDKAEGPNDGSARTVKPKKKIPCPTGAIGDFNIQEAMGLGGGSKKKQDTYLAILVFQPLHWCWHGFEQNFLCTVKELTLNVWLNWELEWAEIPVWDKATFFQVVSQI